MALDTGRGTVEQRSDILVAGEIEATGAGRVESPTDAAHGVHLETLGDLRLVADQAREAHSQGGCQRVGEGRQQHAALRVPAGQMHRPVEGHDGLAGARRPRDAGGAVVLALDELPLRRMQEDRPLLPGIVEGPLQRLDVRHHPEAPVCVGVRERIGVGRGCGGQDGSAPGGELQQRLGGLGREVIGEVEQRVLGGRADVAQPFGRHAVAEQVVVLCAGEDGCSRRRTAGGRGSGGRRHVRLDVPRHRDLPHRLADLDELRRPRGRMPLQPPPLGPLIGGVVMVHVAEQEARRGPVDDQPDVAADPGGPEALVLRPLDLVQLQPWPGRVHLQVERGGLDRLLLVAGQLREAVGEGVGDAELHCLHREAETLFLETRHLRAPEHARVGPTYRQTDHRIHGEVRRHQFPESALRRFLAMLRYTLSAASLTSSAKWSSDLSFPSYARSEPPASPMVSRARSSDEANRLSTDSVLAYASARSRVRSRTFRASTLASTSPSRPMSGFSISTTGRASSDFDP